MGFLSALKTKCSICKEHFLKVNNHASDLDKLRGVNAFDAKYRSYTKLCRKCWKKLRTKHCSNCKKEFNVLYNKRSYLLENFNDLGLKQKSILDLDFICPDCVEDFEQSKCKKCSKVFLLKNNKYKTLKKDKYIEEWLYPYGDYHPKQWKVLCTSCLAKSKSEAKEVEKRLKNWQGDTRYEYIKGYKTVKTLGQVEFNDHLFTEPNELEDELRKYSVQLGGNAFVKCFWKKEQHRYFVGYATAVIVEPFTEKPKVKTIQLSDIDSIVIDGMNICNWNSSGKMKPDIRILLTLCVELSGKGIPYHCFFDANARFEFEKHFGKESLEAYESLLTGQFANHFTEVPGKTMADEFLLQKANSDDAHVISNDQFSDFNEKYDWVVKGNRLIKGIVADDHLLIPQLNLDCEIQNNLKKSFKLFEGVTPKSDKQKSEVAQA